MPQANAGHEAKSRLASWPVIIDFLGTIGNAMRDSFAPTPKKPRLMTLESFTAFNRKTDDYFYSEMGHIHRQMMKDADGRV